MKIRNLNTALISIGMILGGLVAGPVHADQPIFSLNQVGSGAQRDQNSRSALSAAAQPHIRLISCLARRPWPA